MTLNTVFPLMAHTSLVTAAFVLLCLSVPHSIAGGRENADRLLGTSFAVRGWRQAGGSGPIEALRNRTQTAPRTLLTIHTAQSAWTMTTLMLVSLASTIHESFDVLLIDDHSPKGDLERHARAWGIQVLSWGQGTEQLGATHSWNLAWAYFRNHSQYDTLIICNNDLLVPAGTITKLIQALDAGWGLVLPIVSHRGSPTPGHRLHETYPMVPAQPHHWTNSVLNFQLVQAALDAAEAPNGSLVRPVKVPNGYMMAMRKSVIMACEFRPGLLFNPRFINVGNEDDLARRCSDRLRIGVHTGAFVFHYKGLTINRHRNRDDTKGKDLRHTTF